MILGMLPWCGRGYVGRRRAGRRLAPLGPPWVATLAGGSSNQHFLIILCDPNFIPATQSPNSVLGGGVLRGLQAEGAQRRGAPPGPGAREVSWKGVHVNQARG